jgi:hypothetical protein
MEASKAASAHPLRGARLRPWPVRALWLLLAPLCAVACEAPLHPSDPGIPAAICEPRCRREHDCDPKVDVRACANHCEQSLSPTTVYQRKDFVTSLTECSLAQTCAPDLDRSILSCQWDVRKRLEPTALDGALCHGWIDKTSKCGDYRWDEAHCIEFTKVFSEPILRQLSECMDRPCKGFANYGRCEIAVLGGDAFERDPVAMDRDRQREFFSTPTPDAGPAQARLKGRIASEDNAPIAEATVCLRGFREGPCTRSSESGAFALQVPAHEEIALSAVAAGFGARLVGHLTRGDLVTVVNIPLVAEAASRNRYAAAKAPFPDDAAGSVWATVQGPDEKGLEGATIDVEPKPERSTLYFASSSAPDPERKATSTWGHGLAVGVAPGEATVTVGPPSLTCVPVAGAWPSSHPNSVRVPIVAGLETRVVVRCHW